jgi:hypothetical protein
METTTRWRVSVAADLVASIAMVVAAAVLVWKATTLSDVGAARVGPPAPSAYKIGDRLEEVKGLDITLAEKTLVLYLRSTCKFCTASMPFYRTIAQRSGAARLAVVGPEPEEVLRDYVDQHSFVPDALVSVPFGRLRFAGTPTLALLDANGRMLAIWRGQLPPNTEAEVRQALR